MKRSREQKSDDLIFLIPQSCYRWSEQELTLEALMITHICRHDDANV